MINSLKYAALLAALFVFPMGNQAYAADTSFALTLQKHKFSPSELTIPADTKVKISVKNLDKETAEFISDDFKGGKVIPGGKEASFFIGPLKAGTYEFHDEYHEAPSKSRLTVK